MSDPTRWSAVAQLSALASGELSAVELLAETRAVHDAVNPRINAVVTTDFDRAEQAARASDRRRADGHSARPLEGLPVAVKELRDVAGLRTTYGSLLHTDHVPAGDSLVVARMRAAGAVIYGKTNTPEWGTGSHTYNRVFGTTTNPYAPDRTVGGSSGGAAAALAAGLCSVADGSDMGGSLRNPAAFCNVVGLRPSIGRVPDWPVGDSWDTLSTCGPMARTVADAVLLLSVLSGPDVRSPLAFPDPFPDRLPELSGPLRIGWSRTLGGLDIEAGITEVLEGQGLPALVELGHAVRAVEPDLAEADAAFRTLRGLEFARTHAAALETHRDQLGPELIENTEIGLGLTAGQVNEAIAQRQRVHQRMLRLFDDLDVLAAPVTTVLPFDAATTWPREINGVPQRDYLDWMRACWRISLTGFPALSVPCGITPDGLPVGLQLIAPPRREDLILGLAAQLEARNPVWQEIPAVLHS